MKHTNGKIIKTVVFCCLKVLDQYTDGRQLGHKEESKMKETGKMRRTAAVMLAVMLILVGVCSAVTVPAFAAAEKPERVTGVKASAKSSSSIRITWNKAEKAKKYQVFRASSKKGKYKIVKTTTGRSFTNKGLKASKKYYYKVCAVNGSKKGKFSTVVSAKTKSVLKDVIVDKSAKTVTIRAKVNGTFFTNSTRHFMICNNSKYFNSGKAILDGYCTPEDLYKGLVEAGGVSWSKSRDKMLKEGEKNSKSNAENKNYSHLSVTVSWGGNEYDLKDCLTTTKGGKKAPKIDMVFSGNPKASAKTPSGCMVCLDSCYIGIVANSAYGLCVIDNNDPSVFARKDTLPSNGKVVKVTFKIKQ